MFYIHLFDSQNKTWCYSEASSWQTKESCCVCLQLSSMVETTSLAFGLAYISVQICENSTDCYKELTSIAQCKTTGTVQISGFNDFLPNYVRYQRV